MKGNIPRAIKVDVIREWLRGKSRDQIAKQVGIGAGTVSSIIQECRQNDTEFDLLRQTAVDLKNRGESIESFASLVRLRETLKRESSLLPGKNTTTGGITTTIAGGQKNDNGDLKTQQLREEIGFDEKLESLL
jgi:transposase